MRTAWVPDVTSDLNVTLRLLDQSAEWRQRLVETFEFRTTHHVRVRSSYQFRLTRDLIGPKAADRDIHAARVRLPLTTRPNRPLTGFNAAVADVRGYVPLRREIAATQAEYLSRLIASSPARGEVAPLLPSDVCLAICSFAPGVIAAERGLTTTDRMQRYLEFWLAREVPYRRVQRWMSALEPGAALLASVLEERPDPLSSSEQFLLAVPLVNPEATVADVERMVEAYTAAVDAARRVEDLELLEVLAEYGRRWEVLLDAEVPLDEPCLAKVEEDRPLHIGPGGRCTQRLWLGDAPSYHAELRVLDPAVVFHGKTAARNALGTAVPLARWEGRRITNDALSLYSSAERPFFLDLTVRLRPAWAVRTLGLIVEVVAAMAIGLLWMLDLGEQRVETVAVLAVPATFPVALLAVREQTSLAGRVQRWRHARLVLELGALWAAAVRQLVYQAS